MLNVFTEIVEWFFHSQVITKRALKKCLDRICLPCHFSGLKTYQN